MKVCYPVLLTVILADLVLTQKPLYNWDKSEQSASGCPTGTKCASLLRCYRIVQKAVHQYGTITASALRLHFSDGQGFYTPMALYKRLVKDSCPGHKRTCCPAMYSVTKVDLLYEAQARTPSSTSEDLVAAESGRGSSVHSLVTPGKKRRLENRAMLEEQCKMRLQNRIFHGQAVKAGQMPWIAMLQYEENGNLKFSCGGTLISDRYILTAAHCANSKKMKLVSARLGEVNLDSDCDDVDEHDFLQTDINSVFGDLLGKQISNKDGANSCAADPLNVPIEEVVVHPGYKYDLVEGFPNDLALVRLAKSVQPSQYVRPICLKGLAKNLTPKEEKEGMLTVAGWGMTDMHDGPRSDKLKQATVKCMASNVCRKKHKLMVRDKCHKCAGGNKGNACVGDSGGPLVLWVQNQMPYLTGVVSFGSAVCGALATPSVFSDLTCYIDWILDTIRS